MSHVARLLLFARRRQPELGGLIMVMKLRLKVLAGVRSAACFMLVCGASGLLACAGDDGGREPVGAGKAIELEAGSVQLPLTARGVSGALYRLRNATFQIEQLDGAVEPPPPPFPEPLPFPGPRPRPPIAGDVGVAGTAGAAGASNGQDA